MWMCCVGRGIQEESKSRGREGRGREQGEGEGGRRGTCTLDSGHTSPRAAVLCGRRGTARGMQQCTSARTIGVNSFCSGAEYSSGTRA